MNTRPTTPLVHFSLLLLLLAAPAVGFGQFYGESFDAGANGYDNGAINFQFQADGAADAFPQWGLRTRIQSASQGGAMVLEGPVDQGRIQSPPIFLPAAGSETIYLSFYQYFGATSGGSPRVIITNDLGAQVDTTLELGLGTEGETRSGSFHVIELNGEITQGQTLTLQFAVEAAANFWILDDIALSLDPPRPVTFPRRYGEALTRFGIPFVVDSLGAPAVPFQLVAEVMDGFTEAELAVFRDMIGARLVRSCACDRLEVWEMPGGVFFDPVSGEPLGDPSDILSRTLPGAGMNKVDEVGLNYFVFNELRDAADDPARPLTAADVAAFPPAPADAVRIAVLDTGLDLDHPDLFGYVFRSTDAVGDNQDNDGDCLVDNAVGWNYVEDNNNPADDNSHGTHVAGVVAQNLRLCGDCAIQLIPYKTHDEHGVGTIFNAACATLQAAIYDKAAVINASWGFYGGGSGILRNAIDTAANYGALFVAAAGNDTLYMDVDPQFPALYGLDNILSVAAHDTSALGELPPADFTNFSPTLIDLAAFGVGVESALPGGGRGPKSGTSQSAPAVSASACLYNCENGPAAPAAVRAALLANARTDSKLTTTTVQARALDGTKDCDQDIEPTATNNLAFFSACYDRAAETLDVRALRNLGRTEVEVFRLEGGIAAWAEDVRLRTGESIIVDLSAAPAGEYLIAVTCLGRTFTQRLVKR